MSNILASSTKHSCNITRFHSWQSQIRARPSPTCPKVTKLHLERCSAAGDRDPSLLPCNASATTTTTMMTRKDISFQINEARIAAPNKGDERRVEWRTGHAKTPTTTTTTTKRGGSIIPDLPAAEAAKWQFKFWREVLHHVMDG